MPQSKTLGGDVSAGGAFLQMTNDVYQSFTGADINASISMRLPDGSVTTKLIGTLTSFTVTTVRDVLPRWAMGKKMYASVAKGKRAISGTLGFAVFDRDPLLRDIYNPSQLDELKKQYETLMYFAQNYKVPGAADTAAAVYNKAKQIAAAIESTKSIRELMGTQPINYADELAPFDITFSMVNDNGAAAYTAVRQITIISSGWGTGMHDMESDQVHQYIARDYIPLQPVDPTQTYSA